MLILPFYKMSGSGNDFILIDNRLGIVPFDNMSRFAAKVCRRGLSVGADGLILIEPSDSVDFKWRFFNSDGSVAEMCGNGARCAARMARLAGIAGDRLAFETLAGVIEAVIQDNSVKIKMTDATDLVMDESIELSTESVRCSRVNTGVPHAVIEVTDIEDVAIKTQGREIRFHPHFAPAGTNVNYIAPLDNGAWSIRTYERGVENETLACGTGNVAAALILAVRHGLPTPVTLKTRSGALLKVHFRQDRGQFGDIHLEGDARVIYQGEMWPEAWLY